MFRCEVCKELRPAVEIGVLSRDVSASHGLQHGTMTRHVNYCKDRPACLGKARAIRDSS